MKNTAGWANPPYQEAKVMKIGLFMAKNGQKQPQNDEKWQFSGGLEQILRFFGSWVKKPWAFPNMRLAAA
jgi:hypothetical protein